MKPHLMLFTYNLNTYPHEEKLICLFYNVTVCIILYSEVIKNYDLADDKKKKKNNPETREFWVLAVKHHLSRDMYLEVAPATTVRENLNIQVNCDYKRIIQV